MQILIHYLTVTVSTMQPRLTSLLVSDDKMQFVTHSLDATGVFRLYEPPSSLPLCGSGTPLHQAATSIRRLSVWYMSMLCYKQLGIYRIAIFKIRPEPDNTGYQTNYLAGTGYLDTCCIIANFLVYFMVRIKCIIRCVCFQLCVLIHCIGLQLIYVKQLVYMTHCFFKV